MYLEGLGKDLGILGRLGKDSQLIHGGGLPTQPVYSELGRIGEGCGCLGRVGGVYSVNRWWGIADQTCI